MHWLKMVAKCILLVLIIVILHGTIILFQTSSLKMYLPHNKKNAIQTAKEYHSMSYEKVLSTPITKYIVLQIPLS